MTSPFKEGMIRRQKKAEHWVAENRTPIVLWINCDHETSERRVSSEEIVRRHIRDSIDIPFVHVSTKNEPRSIVVTEYDDAWEEIQQ